MKFILLSTESMDSLDNRWVVGINMCAVLDKRRGGHGAPMQGTELGGDPKQCRARRVTCLTLGCKGRVCARGLCRHCYNKAAYKQRRTQTCVWDACTTPQYARGFCAIHYASIVTPKRRRRSNPEEAKCTECRVGGDATAEVYALGLCFKHYIAKRREKERAKKLWLRAVDIGG